MTLQGLAVPRGARFRDCAPRCLGAGACREGCLLELLCPGQCMAVLGLGHRLLGGTASGAAAVGFLSARATAVVCVGATVERNAAFPASQSATGHNGRLQLSVTPSKHLPGFFCRNSRGWTGLNLLFNVGYSILAG